MSETKLNEDYSISNVEYFPEKEVTVEFIKKYNLKKVKVESGIPTIVFTFIKLVLIIECLIVLFCIWMGDNIFSPEIIISTSILLLIYIQFKPKYIYKNPNYKEKSTENENNKEDHI